jgi:PAS domain S-box-containing protein
VADDSAGGPALAHPSDTPVVRAAAAVRILLAVATAAVGSFLPHLSGRTTAFFLVLELGWLPYATAVFFAAARPGNPVATVGGPVGDVAILFAVQVLLPASREAVLLGYIVVVIFGIFTAGRRVAGLLAAEAIAVSVAAQLLVPKGDRLSALELVPFSAAVLALLFMLERSAARQAASEELVARLQSKSDTILAHVADAVVVTDHAGVVLETNAAAEQVLGKQGGSLSGRSCLTAMGLHHGERLLDCTSGCALACLADATDPSLGTEVWRLRSDGGRQPLLANTSIVRGSHGDEVVHSLRDVTRLKEAEEAKTLFLATASHELKTPLTVIQGFADTLTRYPDLDPATKAAALEAIRARSIELARIVDRLLMSSRIEAGRINLVVDEIDASPVVADRATAVAAATGRAVEISGVEVPRPASGNAEALVTVVDHLLDNALKYSPEGTAVAVAVKPGATGVDIEVSDRGIGMDREQARHCFEKFWQAESTDVRRFGGTGIGLYIVQSLVEAMGGSVTVASEKGRGTTFSIHLAPPPAPVVPGVGESTSIREFMRQIGVATKGRA